MVNFSKTAGLLSILQENSKVHYNCFGYLPQLVLAKNNCNRQEQLINFSYNLKKGINIKTFSLIITKKKLHFCNATTMYFFILIKITP